MKRVAEQDGGKERLWRGYLAPCARCGLSVVHAHKTGEPFHMHRRSKLCADIAAKRRGGGT